MSQGPANQNIAQVATSPQTVGDTNTKVPLFVTPDGRLMVVSENYNFFSWGDGLSCPMIHEETTINCW